MIATPSKTGDNGGDMTGRFSSGNRFARGNPHARRTARLRAELLRSVGPDDIREIVRALVEKAKSGDVQAIRELLDRVLGKPAATIEAAGALGIPLHPIRVIFETDRGQDHV